MRTTLRKLSAMLLAVLMVASMASLLASAAVAYDLKAGARKLGSSESVTLGTSSQYATLGTSQGGAYFADSIGLWGLNNITSYAPLSNQNGIDIVVECVRGTTDTRHWTTAIPESWTYTTHNTTPYSTVTLSAAPQGWDPDGGTVQSLNVTDGIDYPNPVTYHPAVPAVVISGSEFAPSVYTKKNIYIDLGAWSNPTNSAKWAKYGTKTITIGFYASFKDGVLTWSKVPAKDNTADLLEFYSFQVDLDPTKTVQQIQLFTSDPTSAFSTTSGDNGVWNVYFRECTKLYTDDKGTTATADDVEVPATVTVGNWGWVQNMDLEQALWYDYFHGTHAYTKLFSYDFAINGINSYNNKDFAGFVEFYLTGGKRTVKQWDVSTSTEVTGDPEDLTGTMLDLALLKTWLKGSNPDKYLLTAAYNEYAYLAFEAMQSATGAGFTVTIPDPRIGSATPVPVGATVTYAFTGLKGSLRINWTTSAAASGMQYVTATGGEGGFALVANQGYTLTASELDGGKQLLYWEKTTANSQSQLFNGTVAYPENQNAYNDIYYKTSRAAESTWNFDEKIVTLAKEMNLVDATGVVDVQLVPTIGGDDLIAGLVEKDNNKKTIRDYGYTLNYYVDYSDAFMCQLTIDIHDQTLADITGSGKGSFVVKTTDKDGLNKFVKAFSCTITQYDETFVIPLKDGTFTLLRIKVRTNYDDKVSPLADGDITEFNYSRLTLVEQVKLFNDRLVNANNERKAGLNANKVIYVDLINAIPGSVGADTYWSYSSAGIGKFKVDGFNGVNYYTQLTALLSYVGFNVDGSKPNRNPVGYSRFYNTIADSIAKTEAGYKDAGYDKADGKTDTGLSLSAKQLWDTSFRMVYTKGADAAKEAITVVYYPLTPAQTLNYVAADGNTYVYSVFFHTKYGDMPVAATSLGVAQKSNAAITKVGMYTYVLGIDKDGTRDNFSVANPTTDTGKGFAIGQMIKTETKGVITVTNYWDNTRGLATTGSGISNYNKAITILSVRIPAGATLTVSGTGTGVNAKVVDLKYGTLGLNSPDGLVDAYVTIEYATVSDTTFTLTVNYDDGPDDKVKGVNGFSRSWDVKSTWVVKTTTNNDATKAYNAFTSRFSTAKTLTPAAAVMPSNPNEAQVMSSTPSANSVVSVATSDTSTPAMGNPFNAIAYIITIGASAIGGISTLVIRRRK